MRSGGCTVQQALTSEAANIVKQAVVLAKRRGHAQVTPLHVANTLLSSSSGLLRTACLQSQSQSQSHPLRCKALELCFNVALNRLPTSSSSSSSPMLLGPYNPHQNQNQHQHQHPSISNALVAAFKRAQAHQRRGSIVENHHQQQQQQPLLAVKIDLEQLIISILDDPSVSRVMREAGFSSTQVKTNVEQAIISLDLMCTTSQSPSPSSKPKENNNNNNHVFLSHDQSGGLLKASCNKVSSTPNSFAHVKDEDVMSVVESLKNKRRKSIVIVGECIGSLEGVIKGVMDKVDNINGDCTIDESLKEIKLISVPLSSFANFTRKEVEQKIGELTCLVKSLVTKGVLLYLGDLKWITDYRANSNNNSSYYYSVEHMIMELGRLVCSIGENGKFWLVGIATFQTYMRCRNGHNSLESIWGLHPVTVPTGSLGLSLNSDSDTQLELRSKASENGSCGMIVDNGDHYHEKQLTCCADCSSKFKLEALSLQQNNASNIESSTLSSSLPSWLKDERQRLNSNHHHEQKGVSIEQLCKKWNSICNSSHKKTKMFERSLTFPSSTSPSSIFNSPFVDPEVHTWREKNDNTRETSLRIYIPEHSDGEPRNAFSSSNPNSTPNSASSSDQIMEMDYYTSMFKEFNLENLKILTNALEEKVPWQKEVIREISGTILQCRSGMIKRNGEVKEDTWLFFQGNDVQAKEKIARELAKVVFGSYARCTSIALSSFSSMKLDYKRSRDEQSCSYIERFAQGVSSNPHRVFFVEDVEQVDYCSQRGIKKAIERGKITNSSGEEVSLRDAIIILSCDHESFISSRSSRGVSPCDGSDNEEIKGANAMEETRSISPNCVSLDLNISIDDHETSVDDQQYNLDDIRLLDSVDRCIMFRIQEM
ncbi:protein SMAX1-LIKE 3 isoform X1 [Lycium ferocissimum]|uniref:protein SMAX1-LIKE 3 isoform X1 n=1 Tax=Lycium ferocissimum TaxID=112874 RepID=UPI00281622BB|nr:protein SMAX1-LIKE 3 isoform X1 [Lycium ferocissimum]